MVNVRITETYDLSTKVDTMGVIGIHTPSTSQIERVWGNLLKSHSHFKIEKMDCVMACASLLPADPLQIGTESGEIAPQDLFNPILYTAVSNEGFNRLLQRIYTASAVGGVSGASVVRSEVEGDEGGGWTAFDIYYGLLAESDRYKKAMPQAGLEMRGVVPLVYPILSTYGNGIASATGDIGQNTNFGRIPRENGGWNVSGQTFLRGRPQPMPAIPTAAVYSTSATQGSVVDASYPPTFVSAIIIPPSKLHKLYYRLSVTWTISFTGLRSDLEAGSIPDLAYTGQNLYATDYANQSAKFETTTDSVDVSGIEVEPVFVNGS